MDYREVPLDHRCCSVVELKADLLRTKESYLGFSCQHLSTLVPGHGCFTPPERTPVGMQPLLILSERGSKIHRCLEALILGSCTKVMTKRTTSLFHLTVCWRDLACHGKHVAGCYLRMPSITATVISSSVLSTNGLPEPSAFFTSGWRFVQSLMT